MLSRDELYSVVAQIPDPEIPVISIDDLGILRNVELVYDSCIVTITPTYSGCPAMKVIEDDIRTKLLDVGVSDVQVKLVYSPAWTTDWINPAAKERLNSYGIVPPKPLIEIESLMGKPEVIICPQCSSSNTVEIAHYASTACKALYKCKEPFDHFKTH
jgi:ring-1,2-phenylacetyl-CoA epoxidase subunit PaaD